jgi:hypothetical protein
MFARGSRVALKSDTSFVGVIQTAPAVANKDSQDTLYTIVWDKVKDLGFTPTYPEKMLIAEKDIVKEG